jgi:sugar phosphate isomerase/epimerase
MAEFLNEVGRVCVKNGVRCLYHNHWTECETDGLEQLCKLTDSHVVGFAFDTGHAVRAGKDPAAIIGVLGKRLSLIHFADASEDVQTTTKRPPLGEGQMKIPMVVEALRKVGFKQWIVLEEEATTLPGRKLAEKGLAVFHEAFQQPQ